MPEDTMQQRPIACVSKGARADQGPDNVATYPSLFDRLGEWVTLHYLLRELLDALAPFRAGLAAPQTVTGADSGVMRAMYVDWRACQSRIYALVEFGEQVQHVGSPFRREPRHMRGARWAVEIAALQLTIESALADRGPDTGALEDLVDELETVCHRHLAIADREILALGRAGGEPPHASARGPA